MLGQSFNCTIFVPYKVYFEIIAPSQTVWVESYQLQSKKIIRFVIEMMDWLFFRQSIWYCIYFRQIWLVKGICISFPHLNLHPTFHPPGGAPCTSYLSSIRFERAREDPSNLSSITETALHRLFITQHHLTASATWCSDRKNKRLTKKGEIIKRYIQKSEDHKEVQEYHCKCA